MSILKILGGKQEISHNSKAWNQRTENAPMLNPETQPVLFYFAVKCAALDFLKATKESKKSNAYEWFRANAPNLGLEINHSELFWNEVLKIIYP